MQSMSISKWQLICGRGDLLTSIGPRSKDLELSETEAIPGSLYFFIRKVGIPVVFSCCNCGGIRGDNG